MCSTDMCRHEVVISHQSLNVYLELLVTNCWACYINLKPSIIDQLEFNCKLNKTEKSAVDTIIVIFVSILTWNCKGSLGGKFQNKYL